MTRPSSLAKIKSFLQVDDDSVKTNCFKFLHHVLCRTFDTTVSNEILSASSFGGFASANQDSKKTEEKELQEMKNSVKEELFQFMSEIVQLVIAFDFSITSSVSSSDKELTFAEILGAQSRDLPRFGMMRMSALEVIDKLHMCYGLRMLEVFKEADLFSSLIKMYALYPYNDIALRYVSNILCFTLDHKLAK